MINLLLKGLVDLIYGTTRVRRKFEIDYPNEKVLVSDASKGIMTDSNQQIKNGLDWVTSQRAVLLLTEKRIVCGKWSIPIETISSANMKNVISLFGSGQVLKIETKDNKNYQFGMQLNSEWMNQKRLPLIIEKGELSSSNFSVIIRILVIGYLIYWIFERYMQK